MNLILTLMFVIVLSYLSIFIARKLKIPSVVALIILGLILSMQSINDMFIAPNTRAIYSLGNIGLLGLMFLAGLESSWKVLWDEQKDATIISLFGSLIPLIFGFAISMFLGFSVMISLIVGICISITAEGTTAKVLMDIKKLKTRVGAAIMGAGIIDDMIGLSLFVLISYVLKKVYIKEDLLIAGAILAFFIGIILQSEISRRKLLFKVIDRMLLYIIVPFFFIAVGIHFDMFSLILEPSILILILIIAVISKLLGVFLTKPFVNFNWKQLHLIGWGMNSRGAVGMALALIAFRSELISVSLYSSLILITLITTLIFPFIISYMIKKNPKIMD